MVTICPFISWDPDTKCYRIKRSSCKLNGSSAFAISLKAAKSISTANKATLNQLNTYYESYGTAKPKKYKIINVNIKYPTIEQILFVYIYYYIF